MNSLAHDASGTAQDVTLGYSYNPAGQIAGRTVSNPAYLYGASPTGATAYAVDGLNQLDSIDSVAVTQDSRGNVTNVLGRTYGYDRLDRMISANAGAGASLFTYDPTSRLATSRVGGVTSQRQYAGDQLVAEYNPATGAMTKRYIPGLGLDDVAVAYDGSGTSTRNWQLADERGSVIALAGSTGAVSNINTYDEYGVPASGNVGRFQYTGQQWLPEAGAYHYRARAYLPQTGRFLQTDPAGYGDGLNLYGYVGGDPVNFSDPFGFARAPRSDDEGRCAYWYRVDDLGNRHIGGGGCVYDFDQVGPAGGVFGFSGNGGGTSGGYGGDSTGGGGGDRRGPPRSLIGTEINCKMWGVGNFIADGGAVISIGGAILVGGGTVGGLAGAATGDIPLAAGGVLTMGLGASVMARGGLISAFGEYIQALSGDPVPLFTTWGGDLLGARLLPSSAQREMATFVGGEFLGNLADMANQNPCSSGD